MTMDKVKNKPNVILIQVDQYRASLLSMLGNRNVKTPNLDALVKHTISQILFR